jgi:Rrf2 family transcriptional regulator, iron-sulfur cluster assembly transcription factor
MFSKACEYGIKASIFILINSLNGNRVGLLEIAEEIDSPASFTAKILQNLVKHQIIDSAKGPHGGFGIKKADISKLKLSKVVTAIDGDAVFKGCGLGFHHCNEKKPCSIHHKFKVVRDELKGMLENTTLLELSEDVKNGKSFLVRD